MGQCALEGNEEGDKEDEEVRKGRFSFGAFLSV
jgi:hypothetical protein